MNWVLTSERIPERKQGTTYSQVPCLAVKVLTNNRTGEMYLGDVQILVFNHEHDCWDGEDGDDYDCDINDVYAWMPLPEKPKFKY